MRINLNCLISLIFVLFLVVSGNSNAKSPYPSPRQKSYTPNYTAKNYRPSSASPSVKSYRHSSPAGSGQRTDYRSYGYASGIKNSSGGSRVKSTYQSKSYSSMPKANTRIGNPAPKFSSSPQSYSSKVIKKSPATTVLQAPKTYQTNYEPGQAYKSGMPKVDRNEAAKKAFLKQRGLDHVPPGFQVDHIVPLSKGGQDNPSNMQLLPISVHQQKTANERRY